MITSPHETDFLFAEHCLSGNSSAVGELRTEVLGRAERFLVHAGIPPSESADVARDLWADLLTGSADHPPLLQKYHGRCALATWLNRVAFSKALTRRRTEDRRQNTIQRAGEAGALTNSDGNVSPATTAERADEEVRDLLKGAIQRAMNACEAEDFVLLHLMHAGDLQVQELSRIFKCDPKTVNSRAKLVSKQMRFAIEAEIRAQDPWLQLSFDDILALLEPDISSLL